MQLFANNRLNPRQTAVTNEPPLNRETRFTPATTKERLSPNCREFADHIVDVITEDEFIPLQTTVTIIQTDGSRFLMQEKRTDPFLHFLQNSLRHPNG